MDKDESRDSVISRELRAEGACGHQSAGHVTFDPPDLSHHNLRLNHFSNNFPSLDSRAADTTSRDGRGGFQSDDHHQLDLPDGSRSLSTSASEELSRLSESPLSLNTSTHLITDRSSRGEVNTGSCLETTEKITDEVGIIQSGFDPSVCSGDNLVTGLSASDLTGEREAGFLSTYPLVLAKNNGEVSSCRPPNHERGLMFDAAQSEVKNTTSLLAGVNLSEQFPDGEHRLSEEPTQSLRDVTESKTEAHYYYADSIRQNTVSEIRGSLYCPAEFKSFAAAPAEKSSGRATTVIPSSETGSRSTECSRTESKTGLFAPGESETGLFALGEWETGFSSSSAVSSSRFKNTIQLGADRESVRTALNLCFSRRGVSALASDGNNGNAEPPPSFQTNPGQTTYPEINPLTGEIGGTVIEARTAEYAHAAGSHSQEPTENNPSRSTGLDSSLAEENAAHVIQPLASDREPTGGRSCQGIQDSNVVTKATTVVVTATAIDGTQPHAGLTRSTDRTSKNETAAGGPESGDRKSQGIRRRPTPAPIHSPFFRRREDEEVIFAALGVAQGETGFEPYRHNASSYLSNASAPHCSPGQRKSPEADGDVHNFRPFQNRLEESCVHPEHHDKTSTQEFKEEISVSEQDCLNQRCEKSCFAGSVPALAKFGADCPYSSQSEKESVRFAETTSTDDNVTQEGVDICSVSSAAEQTAQTHAEKYTSVTRLFPGNAEAPDAVAIETTASNLAHASSQRRESYCCGGAVSVLPPIVERAESDVMAAQPIAESRKPDAASAMLSGKSGELQKFPLRGRRLAVEPFFVAGKKSDESCPSDCVQPPDTKQQQQQSEKNPDIRKVRKIASYQLPVFSLRQTSKSALISPTTAELSLCSPQEENEQTDDDMASKQNNKNSGVSGTVRKQKHGKPAQDKSSSSSGSSSSNRNPPVSGAERTDEPDKKTKHQERKLVTRTSAPSVISKTTPASRLRESNGAVTKPEPGTAKKSKSRAAPGTAHDRTSIPPITICSDSTETEPWHETSSSCSSALSSATSPSKVVYNVCMSEDNIRVDIGGVDAAPPLLPTTSTNSSSPESCVSAPPSSPLPRGSAGPSSPVAGARLCANLVLTTEQSGSNLSFNNSGTINSPWQLSGSDDDFFADDMTQGFHLWSERKPGRGSTTSIPTTITTTSSGGGGNATRATQQHADPSLAAVMMRTTTRPGNGNGNSEGEHNNNNNAVGAGGGGGGGNYGTLPRRAVSDGFLCQKKVRHLSLESDPDRQDPSDGGSGHPPGGGSASLYPSAASSSSASFALSPSRRHSLAVTLEDKRDRVRRNSVTVLIPKGSLSSPFTRHQSPTDRGGGGVGSGNVSAGLGVAHNHGVLGNAPRRRWSSRTALEKTLLPTSAPGESSVLDISARLEFLTWTHLLRTHNQGELKRAKVTRSEIVVTIPVCEVTKDGSTISVTSVDAIEQTLYHFHPALQILLSGGSAPAAAAGKIETLPPHQDPPQPPPRSQPPSSSSSSLTSTQSPPSSDVSNTTSASGSGLGLGSSSGSSGGSVVPGEDSARSRKWASPSLAVSPEDRSSPLAVDCGNCHGPGIRQLARLGGRAVGDNRRKSINTCIRTMREGSGNYDSQLQGCENMGSFADEETLKVVLAKSDAISCVINAMKLFLEKEELQRHACASLFKMASTSEANCRYISQNDGVAAITNTMRRYENNLEVTKLALCILGYISTTEELTVELLSYGCHSDVLAAMSRHSDDRTIVNQSCFILGNLVTSVETAQQLMLVGGVHTVISMLKRYHDDTDILENGCRALGSFALYDETCLDVAQAGATETVVEALTSPYSDDNVKDCCCWALACLTSIPHTCMELVSLNGLPAVLDTLEDYPLQETLQDYGVRTLCNVGALESTVHHVASCRVIRMLTSLHENFPDNVELLEYMTLALSQIAAVEHVQEYLLAGGALKTVLNVMKSLEENPVIQENGCRILGNLAVTESLRKSVEQQGSSQAVIAAMLNIDMCADIQWYGCMALMNLTADLTDNKMRVKNNGAVPTLLATLRNFPANREVVLSALKTLGNLVDLEEACRQLLDDRGLPTIVQIAKDATEDDEIRSFAGLVLSGLTPLPDLPIDDLLLAVETLVTLQAAIPTDGDLALSMCQGLHNLTKSNVGLETLSHAGWMMVIENTMNHFQTHCEIHLTAIRIVATVATECRRNMEWSSCPLSEDTMTSILHSMRLFRHDKEVQVVACAALSCVCEAFGHLRSAIMKEGGVNDVISAMKNFPTDDRLHSVGLIALAYLLPVDITTDRDLGRVVADAILISMTQFVENEHIQISAFRALERCSVEGMEAVFSLLTSVHNGVRRHGGNEKVICAAGRVFKRFGIAEAEGITEQMLTSPSTPFIEIIGPFLKK